MSRRVGRPLDPTVEERVLAATAALLASAGYDRLRIDQVAAASGVAKTTIYRRWPSLTHLAVGAASWAAGDRVIERTGDLRDDLAALLHAAYPALVAGEAMVLRIGLDLARHEDRELHAAYRRSLIDPVREQAIAIVAAGLAAGQVRSTVSPTVAVDALIGGLIYRLAFLHEEPDLDAAERFGEEILEWICGS